jgi:putative ABC transport system substrate-binding protein
VSIQSLLGLILLWGLLGGEIARADETARLGFVWPVSESESPTTEFWGRLRTLGWEEGRNLVERRYADGRIELLQEAMATVVAKKVDVIVTVSTPAALAARTATSTVPIVVGAVGDPVQVALR